MVDRLRVLIIDNDEQSLNTSREALEGCGYLVDTAVNGQEALETARRNPPVFQQIRYAFFRFA